MPHTCDPQVELLSRLNTHIVLPQLAAAEADRNYKLLEAILPPRIIARLKTGSKVIAEQHEQVSKLCLRASKEQSLCGLYRVCFALPQARIQRTDAAADARKQVAAK